MSLRTLLAAMLLAVAGCNSPRCFCPVQPSGPGWCVERPPPGSSCQCSFASLCPGYCLPDGGAPAGPPFAKPFVCDGGT